ncbi:hypothetical protein D3C79_980180 [compost metagenome]
MRAKVASAPEQGQFWPLLGPVCGEQPGASTVVAQRWFIAECLAGVHKAVFSAARRLRDGVGVAFDCQPGLAIMVIQAELIRLQASRQHGVMGERPGVR